MVGDGSYLMMPTELVTAVQEGIKIIVVLVQNHGFASIGSLSESLGSQRFGTRTATATRRPAGSTATCCRSTSPPTPAASAPRDRGDRRADLEKAIRHAKAAPADAGPILIHVQTDPLVHAPDSESWWDVPVSQVSDLDTTRRAHDAYTVHKARPTPLPGADGAERPMSRWRALRGLIP